MKTLFSISVLFFLLSIDVKAQQIYFEPDTNSFCLGSNLTVTNLTSVSGYDTTNMVFYWAFGDGTTDTSYSQTHLYNTSATYNITMTADSLGTIKGTYVLSVTVYPVYEMFVQESICGSDSIYLEGAYQNQFGQYRDTLTSISGCDSVIVTTLNVAAVPDPGVGDTTNNCSFDFPYSLDNILDTNATTGGTWNDDDASGAIIFGQFFPVLAGEGVYNFTYVLDASLCPGDSTTYTIEIHETPFAGFSSTTSSCISESVVNLWLSLTPLVTTAGGTWIDLDNSGGMAAGFVTPFFTGLGTFDYAYTVQSNYGCGSDTAIITLNVQEPKEAGEGGNALTCDTQYNVDLAASLDATHDFGGYWEDTDTTGSLTDSIMQPTISGPGLFTFYYFVGNAGCGYDSTFVRVTVEDCIDAIDDNKMANNVLVFPNPSQGRVTIETTDPGIETYIIYGTAGNLVIQGTIASNKTELQLNQGTYFIEFVGTNRIIRRTLIVN